jgi:hypothetical protein
MTKAQIAQLKEEITADYKRELEALELVEQMFDQQQKSQSRTGLRNKVQSAKAPPAAKVSGTTIAARIEQAFQKQPKWTAPALMVATGAKHRESVWRILNRLLKERKIRISHKGGPGRRAEYTKVIE